MGLFRYVCVGCGIEMLSPFFTGHLEHTYYNQYDEHPNSEKILLYHMCKECAGKLKIDISFSDKSLGSSLYGYKSACVGSKNAT